MKNKCFALLKVQFTEQFKRKGQALLLFVYFVFCVIIFIYSLMLGMGLSAINMTSLIPSYTIAITGIITLFFTILKTNGVLFSYKDYDLLMSFPIKTDIIITSRFLTMYIMNLFFTLLVMIPMGISYILTADNINLFSIIVWILGSFLAPLIPTTLATIIGFLIMLFSSHFKYANIITTLLSILLILAILGVSLMGQNLEEHIKEIEIASISSIILVKIHKLYPIAVLFYQAIERKSILSFFLFIFLSIGWYFIFVKLVAFKYKQINTSFLTYYTKNNYYLKAQKKSSPLFALYCKELKRFFSCSCYVINIGIGVIFAIATSLACFLIGIEKIQSLLQLEITENIIIKLVPFLIALLLSTSCTTCVSLSLEGKNLWILKTLPINKMLVYNSKILVNLTLLIPSSLFCSLLFCFCIPMNLAEKLILFLIPVISSFFTSIWGMYINIKFPNYNWTSETVVIKQSINIVIGSLVNLIFGIIPIILLFLLKINSFIIIGGWAITITFITILLYCYIKKLDF